MGHDEVGRALRGLPRGLLTGDIGAAYDSHFETLFTEVATAISVGVGGQPPPMVLPHDGQYDLAFVDGLSHGLRCHRVMGIDDERWRPYMVWMARVSGETTASSASASCGCRAIDAACDSPRGDSGAS